MTWHFPGFILGVFMIGKFISVKISSGAALPSVCSLCSFRLKKKKKAKVLVSLKIFSYHADRGVSTRNVN